MAKVDFKYCAMDDKYVISWLMLSSFIQNSKWSYAVRFLLFAIGLNDIRQCFYINYVDYMQQ